MFEPLFARLSDRYHLVAPDYPGFGHSDWPDAKEFTYTFDHYAEIMNHLTEALGLLHYTLYMQDYGGPVGFSMAMAYPERIGALIVQNAVAHDEGLGPIWKTRRAFWANRDANDSALRTNPLSLATTRTRHVGSDPSVERNDPDLWTGEFAFLSQSGQADIQSDLSYDYRTNVDFLPNVAGMDAREAVRVAGAACYLPLLRNAAYLSLPRKQAGDEQPPVEDFMCDPTLEG
jgi:pimeloyl-ACP methyl ester carboxylesterase